MGGELGAAPEGKSPSFLVAALKDSIGANLDRYQIVEGWIDKDGNLHEMVYDVAWSGDRKAGADGKLPSVGDTVDVYTSVAGTVRLFEPNVKVLAIPSIPGPSGGGTLVLKIQTADAARFAFANDNAQFWFALRPVVGAKPTARSSANASTLLR